MSERRPLAATGLLSAIAFVFAGTVGVGTALLFIVAVNDASSGTLVAGGIALLLFALFATSAISKLHVPLIWPLLGVGAGFVGLIVWLAYALSGMD